MDFKNLAYPFEDVADAPFNVVRILNECYNDYSNGNLGDGERMASGDMVRGEFLRRIAQIGYDELKYKDIADTLEEDVEKIMCDYDLILRVNDRGTKFIAFDIFDYANQKYIFTHKLKHKE